ncbi:hypothetical protein L0U85_12615 [Glycomyces sp. L485]|uniref:hypothetical protein n=1 Tax=Glycomyces sp. L485 TaxID=2909235 RepID=UPI001F4BB507|nr:hypothetical protein [Glycomyces sp. L485]MCH7231686.1 hypothetical protein [Glycomyces sp. L485]
MTTKKKRAKVARRVTTGVAAASVVGVAVAGAALAAKQTEQATPKLPAPGATIEVDLTSKGIELAFVGQKIHTGPLQGKATFEIESNKGDPSSVRTRISEFYLTSPVEQGGVTIAIAPASRKSRDQSVLRLTTTGSSRFQHTLAPVLNITVQSPRVLGLPAETGEPLSLVAKEPAELLAKLPGFPPKGAAYKLKTRPTLTLPEQSDIEVASILKFPLKVEGL